MPESKTQAWKLSGKALQRGVDLHWIGIKPADPRVQRTKAQRAVCEMYLVVHKGCKRTSLSDDIPDAVFAKWAHLVGFSMKPPLRWGDH